MNATIVSVGTELTSGQCVDTNAAWLSAELTRAGVVVVRHVTTGDDVGRLAAALREALDEVDVVIATGGLGPTADDLTREAIATALEAPLEENAGALGQLRAMFERLQRPFLESNKVQALIPRGCAVIANPRGTAPGIAYSRSGKRLFALPGVPAEMKTMFEAAVIPAIRATTQGGAILWKRLQCFGIGEARLGEVLADLMSRGRNPLVGTTASGGVISVRVQAHGKDEDEARRLAETDAAEVRRRLGRAVFAEEDATLAQAVAELLLQQGKTVATAESCTGGLLAKQLTDVPGSSAYFLRGYIAYSNEAKSALLEVSPELILAEGAVSDRVARAMACGCKKAAGTDFALATTGIAGPGGGDPAVKPVGLVYVALAGAEGVEVKRLLLGEHLARTEIRDRASKSALYLLRLQLLGPEAWSVSQ